MNIKLCFFHQFSLIIWKACLSGVFYSLSKAIYKNEVKVCLLDKLPYISGSTDHIKVNQIKTKYLNTSGWNKVIHVYDIYACQYLHAVRAVSKKKKKKVWKKMNLNQNLLLACKWNRLYATPYQQSISLLPSQQP